VSYAGQLLVATPLIGDPHFERSVVMILAHGSEGAFGVIVNRPTDSTVAEVAPEWSDHVTAPGVVFLGGPVAVDTLTGIGRPVDETVPGYAPLVAGVGSVDLNSPPPSDRPRWAGLRLFAGSAGWAEGQLEDEIREGAWWVLPAAPDDVLTSDPSTLWARVLRRQRPPISWFANCPLDPSAN
jgi:putative transcriptional regulator